MQTKLTRSKADKMIGGVCGGIAAYLSVDSVLVRFAFIMLIFASGIGLPLYFILLILMPVEEKTIDVVQEPDLDFQKEIKITQEDIDNAQEYKLVANGRSQPQGPIIFAGMLIMIGLYLLAQNFGFLGFLNIGWFGPLLIIGIGLFVIYRRR